MRHLVALAFALQCFSAFSQSVFFSEARASMYTDLVGPSEIVVVQINAEWNSNNTREDLQRLRGCDYRFGWLEQQPEHLQKTISAVPVVVAYKDGRPVYQWASDITLSLKTPFEEIQEVIYKLAQ